MLTRLLYRCRREYNIWRYPSTIFVRRVKELKISAITRLACKGTYDLTDNAHIVDVIALLPNDSSHRSLTTFLSGQPSVIHSAASLCWLTTPVFQIGASDCGRTCRCQRLAESTLYIPGTSSTDE